MKERLERIEGYQDNLDFLRSEKRFFLNKIKLIDERIEVFLLAKKEQQEALAGDFERGGDLL